MSGRDANQLAADVEKAIADLVTDGTIVCAHCNASDVTDDDHRAGCGVWPLRKAIAALVGTLQHRLDQEIARAENLRGRLRTRDDAVALAEKDAALTNMTGWHNEAQARVNELEAALAAAEEGT